MDQSDNPSATCFSTLLLKGGGGGRPIAALLGAVERLFRRVLFHRGNAIPDQKLKLMLFMTHRR